MNSLGTWWDNFRGAGAAAVTVPSMDGALGPNSLLDRAEVVCEAKGIANATSDGSAVYYSCGKLVHRMADRLSAPVVAMQFDHEVTALAAHSNGALAIGLSEGGVVVRRPGSPELIVKHVVDRILNCPVGLVFASDAKLIVCNGSATNAPHAWRRDLMEQNRSGSVWEIDLDSGKTRLLADRLGYPCGALITPNKGVVVSEAWEHRLIAVDGKGSEALLDDLPGYPGGLSRAADGDGCWLSVFAPRRQLIEFVLREDDYRRRMMETLPEDYWIAPALSTGKSYFEAVQGGGVRRLGILKPWAPTRSYGLLIRLDADMIPTMSYHSRADGARHGVSSCVELGDRVLVASSGAGLLLALDPTIVDD